MTTWVLLAGLPATGKSTLARATASRLRAVFLDVAIPEVAILDKDRIREVLFPGALSDYTREQDELCVRAMLDAAAYLTKRQRVDFIFFDGRTFSRQRAIEQVLHEAESAQARWRILHVTCRDELAERRLAQPDPAHPAQNRTPELYRRIRQDFEPIPYAKLDVDTTAGVEACLSAVETFLTSPGTDPD